MQENRYTQDSEFPNRREFLKTSAKFSAMASVVCFRGFTLSSCSKDSKKADSKDSTNITQNTSTQNLQSAQDSQKGENMSLNPQVWYITGASGGLGLELAKYLLSKGDKVAATSRKLSNIESKLGRESANFLPLELTFNGDMNAKIATSLEAAHKKLADWIMS